MLSLDRKLLTLLLWACLLLSFVALASAPLYSQRGTGGNKHRLNSKGEPPVVEDLSSGF